MAYIVSIGTRLHSLPVLFRFFVSVEEAFALAAERFNLTLSLVDFPHHRLGFFLLPARLFLFGGHPPALFLILFGLLIMKVLHSICQQICKAQ